MRRFEWKKRRQKSKSKLLSVLFLVVMAAGFIAFNGVKANTAMQLLLPGAEYAVSWQNDSGQAVTPLPSSMIDLSWQPVNDNNLNYYAVAIGNSPGAISGFSGAGWYVTQEPSLRVQGPEQGETIYVRLFAYNSSHQEVAPNQIYRLQAVDVTAIQLLAEPTIISPQQQAITLPLNISWQDVQADSYEVTISTINDDILWQYIGSDVSVVLQDNVQLPNEESLFITVKANRNQEQTISQRLIIKHNNINSDGWIAALWAQSGEEKLPQEVRKAVHGERTISHLWDGEKIQLQGAKNEIVAANIVLEAGDDAVEGVQVQMSNLVGPNGAIIQSAPQQDLFNWTQTDIELFYVRYLPIKGVSTLGYNQYDQRHAPFMLRRPHDARGWGTGARWTDRPYHNLSYPDIAVPLALESPFRIAPLTHQAVWMDVYIPDDVPAGIYEGTFTVSNDQQQTEVPVQIEVLPFALPNEPSAKTMVFMSAESSDDGGGIGQIERRYGYSSQELRDHHVMLAHRHKISLIDHGFARDSNGNLLTRPSDEWIQRLTGDLFTAENGYRGPGEQTGTGVYSIATYGAFPWVWNTDNSQEADVYSRVSREEFWSQSNLWESWFQANSPDTERFLYLIDEPGSGQYSQIEQWAQWMDQNPGIGRNLMTLSTVGAVVGNQYLPSVDIAPSLFAVADSSFGEAAEYYKQNGKKLYMYNGIRPAAGSFMIEDEGTSLRLNPWIQMAYDIDRWFYWESTYYKNYDGSSVEEGWQPDTNVFRRAHTFGHQTQYDNSDGPYGGLGEIGASQHHPIGNGDGVLFYPGTDVIHPEESYGVNGPIASLRLKHWRRGIQDADYIALAQEIDPVATEAIIQNLIQRALWDVGVEEPGANWHHIDIGWTTDPDLWDSARRALADIIAQSPTESVDDGFITEDVVFHLPLDTNAIDIGNYGIKTKSKLFYDNKTVINGAAVFNGTGGINVSNSTHISAAKHSKRVVSAWIYPEADGVVYEEGGNLRGLSMFVDNGMLVASGWNIPVRESGWRGTKLEAPIAYNQWSHVMIMLDGEDTLQEDAFSLYINGEEVDRGQGSSLWSHTDGIGIGAVVATTKKGSTNISTAEAFRGMIDDFRIYNRTFTPTQVRLLYNYR